MIVIICGPAGVGKTTVATLLQDRLGARGYQFRMLDSDQFTRNTYDRLYDRIEASDENWIVAGTFYKQEWQERFQRLDDAVLVWLHADLETCLDRNRRRAEPIDDRAVHIIWREFHDPDADLTTDVTDCSPANVVDLILGKLEPSLEQDH